MFCDRVLFVERSSELMYIAWLRHDRAGAVVKARVKCPNLWYALDPKPGDLTMARLKRR